MDQEFWHARWSNNEIGFHLEKVNPYLVQYWATLGLPAGSRVLVPLCGKSLDLCWLAEQGHAVLGIELSTQAVEAFFAEQGLPFTCEQQGKFLCYRSGMLEIRCGDFFALAAADVADCAGLYDRAALIALPEPMREQYVAHLGSLLPAGAMGLLIALDYPQAEMNGPPFSVTAAQVYKSFALDWQVEPVLQADVLPDNPRFAARGLTALHEAVYRLNRR